MGGIRKTFAISSLSSMAPPPPPLGPLDHLFPASRQMLSDPTS